MDIKITLDISDRFGSALSRLVSAIQAVTIQTAPAPISCPLVGEVTIDAPEKTPNSPVEAPEPVEVSRPAEGPKSEPEVKIEAQAAANDNTPAETLKPKRGRRAKVETPDPEPQVEAAPIPEPEPELEPAKPEEPEAPEFPELDVSPVPETPEMTLDEMRAICIQAAKAGKTGLVKGFLDAHNAPSLSKLDPSFYAELAEKVRAAL